MTLPSIAGTKYACWYYQICEKHRVTNLREGTHLHHILPKSAFPEYSDLRTFPQNGVRVTPRVHFILHWCLYMHYKKIGDLQSAIANLRSVTNFAKNSNTYDRMRNRLSYMMTELWKDPTWSASVKTSMSIAAKHRSTEHKSKLSSSKTAWHANASDATYNDFKKKVSNTLKERYSTGSLDAKKTRDEWKLKNPVAYETMRSKLKTTLQSDEYKATKWKTCCYCSMNVPPSTYARSHGENCKTNPLYEPKVTSCPCCSKPFKNLKQHYRHSHTCKENIHD